MKQRPAIQYIQRNALPLLLPLIVILLGSIGYGYVEGLSFLDSLYMTIITVTTVGYREIGSGPDGHLSPAGKILTCLVVLAGLFTLLLAFTHFGQEAILVSARKRRKRMEVQSSRMRDHYILCGYGRMGRVIAEHLATAETRFIVIESDAKIAQDLQDSGFVAIEGDATADETLEKAGVKVARGLVTVLSSDAVNVFVALTARQLNPDLFILARANQTDAVAKLYRAGASKVINPYDSAGTRIAEMLLRPAVNDFMEIFSTATGRSISIEEIVVQAGSGIVGKTLEQSEIRRRTNAIIVAIKTSSSDELKFNPPGNELLNAGDILVAIADRTELNLLADMAR